MVFDKDWFKERQKYLLFFCNNRFTKKIFRRILRIEDDIKLSDEIIELNPNSFKFKETRKVYDFALGKWTNKTFYKADFRTHDKFAKRIFYTFNYYWYLRHFLDFIVNSFRFEVVKLPKLEFAYDSLTLYPQASGGGANTTTDGWAEYDNGNNQTWTTVHNSTGTDCSYTSTTERSPLIYTASTNFRAMRRSMFSFNISTLPAGYILTAGANVFGVRGIDKSNNWVNASFAFNIYSLALTNANTIVTGDYLYTKFGTTAYSNTAISYASYSTTGYNNWTLNSTGDAAITGTIVQISLRESNYDAPNSAPTYEISKTAGVTQYYADKSGTTSDPKLVITYTLPGTKFQLNIGDSWKAVTAIKINIGDSWKSVTSAKVNIGDSWKTIF